MTSRMQEPQTAANAVAAPSVITIDRTSPVPLYFQLAQHYEAAIRSGALKVGSRLDNEVQLAERLGLSRPTVRAAFLYLSNKGLVVRKRGAGTLVANERIDRDVELTSLYDDLAAAQAGRRIRRSSATRSRTPALRRRRPHCSFPEAKPWSSRWKRIRLADGEPIALMHNFRTDRPCPPEASTCSNSTGSTSCCARTRASGWARPPSACAPRTPPRRRPGSCCENRGAALLTMERIAADRTGRPLEFAQHLYRRPPTMRVPPPALSHVDATATLPAPLSS